MSEVVVTVRKQQERLLDVPAAVSDFSHDDIERLDLTHFADYARLTPNLAQVGAIAPGQGTIVLRGLYTGAQQITNTVGFYYDETPLLPSAAFGLGTVITPDPDLADVSRVEVLKGPQGTLYGASTLGGLIRLVPAAPDLEKPGIRLMGGVSAVDGGGLGYVLRESMDMPVVRDRLAISIGAVERQDGGYTTNVTTGHDQLARTTVAGVNLAVRLRLSDTTDVTVRLLSQRNRTDGAGYQDVQMGAGAPIFGERKFASFVDPHGNSTYLIAELVGTQKLDAGVVTASVSRAHYQFDNLIDDSQLFLPIVASVAPAGSAVLFATQPRMTKTSAETRFTSNRIGPLEFLAGAFFTHEDDLYPLQATAYGPDHTPLHTPFANVATGRTYSYYTEAAGFADATWYLTDRIDLGAGLRYASNWQHSIFYGVGLIYPPIRALGVHVQANDQSLTYQVTGRWRPSHDVSAYFRVATGYRPGGPQNNPNPPAGARPVFDPDTVTNYEIGVKGRLFNGRLTYDTDVYHIDWRNVQLNTLFNAIVLVGNVGRASVWGSETHARLQATPNLALEGDFGWNRARLTRVGGPTAAITGAAVGDQLPGSPEFSAAGSVEYSFPIRPGSEATIGAGVQYQGDKISSYTHDPINLPYRVPSYATVDIRASVRHEHWTWRFAIENLSNQNGFTGYTTTRLLASQIVSSTAYLTRPRTALISLSYDY